MRKRYYIEPQTKVLWLQNENLLASQSVLDPTKDEQDITPVDDPYGDEFGSKHSLWDDDDV